MKKVYKENKWLIITFIASGILGIILGLFKVKNVPFVLFSIALNTFIITLIRMIIKKEKIKWNKTEKIWIIISILITYLFYFISILSRKFIYYWDFACYYHIQLGVENFFNISLYEGIRDFVGSTWSGEYGTFLTFFVESIFRFSNRTANAYVLSCVLIFIPYIVISLSILLKKLIKVFEIKNEKLFFIVALIISMLFPIVHATFIYGQPDLFGIVFIFLIITLTIDYDFYKVDYERLFGIGIITFMLLISRRWYMYFILTYYLNYGIYLIFSNIKDKKKFKIIIKHILLYVLVVALFFLVTLFPLFKNILTKGYNYGYYLVGGLKGEFISQISHLGYLFFLIIIVGIIYGVIKKKYRISSLILLSEYLITIILFTKMQNMGLHHSLLFVHIYLYFIYMFILLVIDKKVLIYLTICLSLTNFIFGIYNTNTKVFTDVPLKTPKQNDYYQIKEVGSWLKKNLKDNDAYMIAHNNIYNPDKFRTLYTPDTTITDHLPYGSAVEGVHYFPTALFDAKYIITMDPFINISIEDRYNNVFLKQVSRNKFREIKRFDMKNGYNIIIYERIEKADKEEAEMYLKELEDLSDKYPELYKDVIENYIKENID